MLLHHAVIPYTYFGHTDAKSWIGFDVIVLATDSFFMAMFFFLSGLFVWPGLAHKTPRDLFWRSPAPARPAVRDRRVYRHSARLLRHRAAAESRHHLFRILVEDHHEGPVAKRPDLVRLGAADVRSDGKPAVPAVAHAVDPINQTVAAEFRPAGQFFLFLLAVTASSPTFPRWSGFGPNRWFEFGPFDVQASRVLLYASYFFIGAGIGAAHFDQGVLSDDGRLAKSSWGWLVADARSLIACYG